MLLTSSEGGLLCYLAPARDETLEGAEEQQEGEGREPRDGHLVIFFFFFFFDSLNKCHFLRQKKEP